MSNTQNLDPQSGQTRRMVISVIALVVALLGACVCLFGVMFAVSPALMSDMVTSSGTTVTIGDGVVVGMVCMIPGALVMVLAVGFWLILGRR